MGVVEPPPRAKGVVRPSPKGQKKKGFWGWSDHPQKAKKEKKVLAFGGDQTTHPLSRLGGGSATPAFSLSLSLFLFLFFLFFRFNFKKINILMGQNAPF
jgi:hypothetical protein